MEIHSAGVLVLQHGVVLAILRRGTNLFGLPFGKIEEGEVPEQTALRECREETGLEVQLRDISHPFVSLVNGRMAMTFLAINESNFMGVGASSRNEGIPCWISPYELFGLKAEYPEYNERVLKSFGML